MNKEIKELINFQNWSASNYHTIPDSEKQMIQRAEKYIEDITPMEWIDINEQEPPFGMIMVYDHQPRFAWLVSIEKHTGLPIKYTFDLQPENDIDSKVTHWMKIKEPNRNQ